MVSNKCDRVNRCKNSWWCAVDYNPANKDCFEAMTNADRIRAMTDEELAYEIVKCKEADKFRAVVLGDKEYTVNEWLDWLRQEAST